MISVKENSEDLKLLEGELKATKDAKWYRRLKIIQLSSQGEKVSKLASMFDVCKATVRDYIRRYNLGGLKLLKRKNSNVSMAQCEAVVDWLTKLPFSQFCSIMGIDEADLVFV